MYDTRTGAKTTRAKTTHGQTTHGQTTRTPNGNPHRRLAAIAIALAALAVFGDPHGGHLVTLDSKELALIVEGAVDHVTVDALADWIIQGRPDSRLIDLRDPGSYAEYHIPSAESVPLSGLPDYPLQRNEKIVLYSGGGIHSAQAWMLLRAEGYRGVYMLLGGLAVWRDDILFPTPPPNAVEGQASSQSAISYARLVEVSRYFGGTPGTVAGEAAGEAPARVMPKVEMPSGMPVTTRRKRHKEGC